MSDNQSNQPQKVIVIQKGGSGLGICALIFGFISIFIFGVILVPLSALLGIIAIANKQVGWGVAALICATIGFFTTPIFLIAFGISAS